MAFLFIKQGNMHQLADLKQLDMITFIIAAACHDYMHDGFNNSYHVNRMTDRAIDYHDESVQENFHAARSIRELLKEENNFLENYSKNELKMFRKRHVSLILATDPAKHIDDLTAFKNRIS